MNMLINGRSPEYWREKRLKELAERKAEQAREAERQRLAAERRRQAEAARGAVPNAAPPLTEPSIIQIPSSVDFGIEDIVKNADGDFDFKGLLTPEGLWDVITLAGNQYENGAKLDYDNWIKYSDGTHGFVDGNFVELKKRVDREFRITPARVRYWLMRAVAEKTNSPKHASVVKELSELFYKDDHEPWQHNAELIKYRAGQNAIITTQGWPKGHPFTRSITCALAGDSVELVQGCQIGNELYTIVGDNNPVRVKTVMEYHDKPSTKKTYLWRCNAQTTGERVVVFLDDTGIDCISIVGSNWPARGVRARAKNFHMK